MESQIENLKSKIRIKQRGFTLIELVIYIGTLAIFLAILTQIFTSILDIRTKTEATSSLEQDSRYILSRLLYDIQRAQAISLPSSPGQIDGTLAITIDGLPYTYQIKGGDNLTLTDDMGNDYDLNSVGTAVSDLNFQRLGAATGRNTIRVVFTLTSLATEASGVETKTIQTTIGQR